MGRGKILGLLGSRGSVTGRGGEGELVVEGVWRSYIKGRDEINEIV